MIEPSLLPALSVWKAEFEAFPAVATPQIERRWRFELRQ